MAATHRAAICRTAVNGEQREERRRGRRESSLGLRVECSEEATISRICRLPTTAWADATSSSDGSAVQSISQSISLTHTYKHICTLIHTFSSLRWSGEGVE